MAHTIDPVKFTPVGPDSNLLVGTGERHLTCSLANPSGQEQHGEIVYSVFTYDRDAQHQKPMWGHTVPWTCPVDGVLSLELPVPGDQYGCYWCEGRVTVADSPGSSDFVTTYAVLPPRRDDPTQSFGLGTTFGGSLVAGELKRRMPLVSALGASWTMAFLWWERLELQEGVFSWEEHDAALKDCQMPGVSLFAVLGESPKWLGEAPARKDFSDVYSRTLAAAAQRYAPLTHTWGLLNLGWVCG